MTKEVKSDLQKVLTVLVESAEKRLTHLTLEEADAVRSEIRRIAAETASRSTSNSAQPEKRARPCSRKKSKELLK